VTARIDTLIVGAAPATDATGHYPRLLSSARRVIAADAGLTLCLDSGRMPDAVVGDFDSTSPDALDQARKAGATIVAHPRDKDASDLDLALMYARETGAREVTFTAAFSDRLDHTLAALGTLARSADLQGVGCEPGFDCYPLDARFRPHCALTVPAGTTISLFTVAGESVVSIDGVRWPLQECALGALSSLGLSNRASGGTVSARVHTGSALLFVLRAAS